MNLGLKQLTVAELQHDLKSWRWALDMKEITDKNHAVIEGKILAELKRRGITEPKPLNVKK